MVRYRTLCFNLRTIEKLKIILILCCNEIMKYINLTQAYKMYIPITNDLYLCM